MIIRRGVAGVLFLFCFFILHGYVAGQSDLGKIKCVCIDPGHGGKDPGAVGVKNHEKDIVLKVSLRLGQLIKEQCPDVKVVYTRDRDVSVDLKQRGKMANKYKADLFISVHANSVDDKAVRGIETYVLGTNQSADGLRVAMKENSVIKYEDDYSLKYDGFDPSKAESYIIFSMMQNMYLEHSLDLAGAVQQGLISATKRKDRGVRQAGYLVLKDVSMPAVLVELPFISNPEEEKYLASQTGQEVMAQAIAKGFMTYKKHVERNSHMLAGSTLQESKSALVCDEECGDFFYGIQVASASSKMKKLPQVKNADKVNELCTGQRYCYFVGKSGSYDKVRSKLSEVKKSVKDCFIIAVNKGKMISVQEAREIEKKTK
ncbi:N-acetylmuramoyl-L-alanine amidase [Porphyromonadaceae bacterium OttesenSCG-928-L07]|nr:N-acetylmuramoyl-L-alanine amidase [Porphyromonadaceae bacterium OttesenSCG-928-L07]MDL2251949.1 N-acetylmuramoyl-L-alanine amidase [Odoribacter sp. OttesenSCG-928-J03]MDL2283280.1 N-acetylmuramoyl-L-alanine amidase [Odoribacter sp. OttesenSCG-928-G04]